MLSSWSGAPSGTSLQGLAGGSPAQSCPDWMGLSHGSELELHAGFSELTSWPTEQMTHTGSFNTHPLFQRGHPGAGLRLVEQEWGAGPPFTETMSSPRRWSQSNKILGWGGRQRQTLLCFVATAVVWKILRNRTKWLP